jgi:zinc protease
MKTLQLLPFLGVILLFNIVQAQDLPIDERVTIGTLENGMTYYIMENEKPEDRAEFRLAVNAGSILEDEDQQGLAHFVEHMAFNGTENFEKNELVDYLELTGTRFGPDLNAYTSFDETVYMLQVRTDDQEIFDKGIQIIRDWAGGVTFSEEEIDKERGVVISEWRSRLSAEQRMQQEYLPVLYKDSRYAERLPIGETEVIENAPYDRVKDFYADWYRPELMAVVAVGDFDKEEVEKKIRSMFSDLKNPEDARKRETYSVPFHEETLVEVASDDEAAFTRVRVSIKHPEFEVNDEMSYKHYLTHRLYNIMFNNRLDELSQSADPPFLFAYSGYGSEVGEIDAYTSFATVPEGGSLVGLEALLTELKRVKEYGFLDSELERAKTQMMESAERGVREMDKQESSRLAMRYVYNYLDDEPIPGPQQMLDMYKTMLDDINIDKVNRLPNKWLTEENRTIILTGPEGEEKAMLPDEEKIQQVIAKINEKEVEAYTENALDEPLVSNLPKPGSVTKRDEIQPSGITEVELSNGVQLVLKPTDFQNDEIKVRAQSPGGHSLYGNDMYFTVGQSAGIIDECGYGNYSSTDLKKKLAGKTVSMNPYVGFYYEGLSGSSSVKDLETLMQLIHLAFTQPRKDEELFKSWQNRNASIYGNLMANPQYFFINFAINTIYKGYPRAGIPSADQFQSVDLDKAYQAYQERFADANDFRFYFVGNFDVNELVDYAKQYIATLPVKEGEEKWEDRGMRALDGGLDSTIYRGKAEKTNVQISLHEDTEYSEEQDFIYDAMLGVLRIKLRESMREDKGGVYGVRVSGGISRVPHEKYSITVSFNSDPERTEELVKAVYAEVENLKENGPDSVDVEKVKETTKQSYIKNLKENDFWIRKLQNYYQYDKDPNQILMENWEGNLDLITAENIHQAAQKYLASDEWIQLMMFPEKDMEAKSEE